MQYKVGTHISYHNSYFGVSSERHRAVSYDVLESEIEGKPGYFKTKQGHTLKVSTGEYSPNYGDLVFAGRHKPLEKDPLTGQVVDYKPFIRVIGTAEDKENAYNQRKDLIEAEIAEDAKHKAEAVRLMEAKAEVLKEHTALVNENNKVRNELSLAEAVVWMETVCSKCKKNRDGFCTVWNRKLEPTNYCSALEPKSYGK